MGQRYIYFLTLVTVFTILNIVPTVFAEETFVDPMLISYIKNVYATQPSEDIPIIITVYDRNKIADITKLINDNNGDVGFVYELIDAISARVPSNSIQKIISANNTRGVYLDAQVKVPEPDKEFEEKLFSIFDAKEGKILESTSGQGSIALIDSTKTIGAPFVWNKDVDGSGIKIAILDTGIDKTHPSLEGKVIAERDFTFYDGVLNPADDHGHGTHVAGTAAGKGEDISLTVTTDQISSDGSFSAPFSNPPSSWITQAPFNVQYHYGSGFWKLLNATIYAIVSKSAARIDNINITDSFIDFPSTWNVTSNSTNIVIKQSNLTMEITGTSSEITSLKIDGVSKSGTETLTWGNSTVVYNTGAGGFVKIVMNGNYNVVYLDADGNFSSGYIVATKGEYFKDEFGNPVSYLLNTEIISDGNSVSFGFDIDGDKKVDKLFVGVAPGAELLNGKVCNSWGYCSVSDTIAGIEWAVLSGTDVISMSLGWPTNICDGSDPLSLMVDKATEMGVAVVAAAANDGWLGQETLRFPGCSKSAITVGATTKSLPYINVAEFSSRGPTSDGRVKPDVVAPGVGIVAPKAKGTNMGYEVFPGYVSASGTSMATPHVAGAVALLLETNSALTPNKIKTILMNGATDIGYDVFSQGAGLINVTKSYDLAKDSKVYAESPVLNIIVENGTTKTVTINTSLTSPISYSAKLDRLITTVKSFSGVIPPSPSVNQSLGFNYTFTIDENDKAFTIRIDWSDVVINSRSDNDIDMVLYDPNGNLVAASSGVTNYEVIFVNAPTSGNWRLLVYPWRTLTTKTVNGTLSIIEPEDWSWVSFVSSTKQIVIKPNVSDNALYSGKLKLSSNPKTTIPMSVIVAKPLTFQPFQSHTFVASPCIGPLAGSPATGGGGAGASYTGGGSTDSLYASFDGFLCNSLERKAYSFDVPSNLPYFNVFISWSTENPLDSFSDIRIFLYSPDGKLYTSDYLGNFESLWIDKPQAGKWFVVVESERYSANIRFSGDVIYPIMNFEPSFMSLNMEPSKSNIVQVNISNFLQGKDLQINAEKDVWSGNKINITPESPSDSNQLGPYSGSYRYYKFNISNSSLSGNSVLRTTLSVQNQDYFANYFVYVFDGNGTIVSANRVYYGYGTSFDFLSNRYQPGQWTVIVAGEGLSFQSPFTLEVWLLQKGDWNWSTVTPANTGFFAERQALVLNITAPNIEAGDFYAGLYLSGAWYSKIDSTHTLYLGLAPKLIPFFVTVRSPPKIVSFAPLDGTYVQGSAVENFTVIYTEGDLDKIILFYKKSTDLDFKNVTLTSCSSGVNQACTANVNLSSYKNGDNIVYAWVLTDKSGATTVSEISSVTIDNSLTFGPYNLFIDNIISVKTSAVADGSDYWEHQFKVTIIGANAARIKMSDWVSGSNTIPIAGNVAMRYNSVSGEKTYNVKNSYNETETVFALSDEDASKEGIQATLTIRTNIPSETKPGSYKSTYAIGVYNV